MGVYSRAVGIFEPNVEGKTDFDTTVNFERFKKLSDSDDRHALRLLSTDFRYLALLRKSAQSQ